MVEPRRIGSMRYENQKGASKNVLCIPVEALGGEEKPTLQIGEIHGRPRFESSLFGKIKEMSYNGCERTFHGRLYTFIPRPGYIVDRCSKSSCTPRVHSGFSAPLALFSGRS